MQDLRKLKCPLEKVEEFLLCAVCTTAIDFVGCRNSLVYLIYQLDYMIWLQVCSHMHYAGGLECRERGICQCTHTLRVCVYTYYMHC